MFTTRRKHAYEALHPETRNGATGNGRSELRQLGEATRAQGNASANLAPAFTADTAIKSQTLRLA